MPYPQQSIRTGAWVMASLLPGLAAGSVGLVVTPKVEAAPFSGVCPVLGSTQPPYQGPLAPGNPPIKSPDQIAIPQVPVRVTIDGKVYPICAVYMSINDSGKFVKDQIPVPAQATDLLFPKLKEQPWFTAPGGSFAQKIAAGLVDNGFWEVNGVKHYWGKPPQDSSGKPDEGDGFLVNSKGKGPSTSSNFSAYFLWSEVGGVGNPKGKARYLWHQGKEQPGSINWLAKDAENLDPNQKYWYWVIDSPGGTNAPSPLPLLGATAAFVWSRRFRQRLVLQARGNAGLGH